MPNRTLLHGLEMVTRYDITVFGRFSTVAMIKNFAAKLPRQSVHQRSCTLKKYADVVTGKGEEIRKASPEDHFAFEPRVISC